MALEQYRNVIAMLISDNMDKTPVEIADEVLKGVRFAQRISGEITEAPAAVRAPLPTRRPAPEAPIILTAEREFPGGLIIGEAPPAANGSFGGRDASLLVDYHTVDDLADLLSQNLPSAMTLKLPGFDTPIEIRRRIAKPPIEFQMPKEGASGAWVRVMYTIPGQEEGPTVVVSTTVAAPDYSGIKQDIADQASKIYRKEVKKIEAVRKAPVVINPDDITRSANALGAAVDNTTQFTNEDRSDAAGMRSAVNDSLRERGMTVDNWRPR